MGQNPNHDFVRRVRTRLFSTDDHHIEMRQYPRIVLHSRALYRTDSVSTWNPCVIVDLSGGGARIEILPSDSGIHAGHRIVVKYRLGSEYELESVIVWTELTSAGGTLGLQWTSIDERLRERLMLELTRVAVKRKRHPVI